MKVHGYILWNFPGYHYTFFFTSFFSFWHHIVPPKMNFQCLDWDCCKAYNVDVVNKYVRSHVDLPISFHWKFYWWNIASLVLTENDEPTTFITSCHSCRFYDVIRLQSIHWGTLEENLFTTTVHYNLAAEIDGKKMHKENHFGCGLFGQLTIETFWLTTKLICLFMQFFVTSPNGRL